MTDFAACPVCRDELEIPAEFRGRAVRCGSCGTTFTPSLTPDVPTVQARPRRISSGTESDDRPPRKSNLGVWAALGLVACVIGCCSGILFITTSKTLNPTLTPHTSVEGKFQVEFPGDVSVENPSSSDDRKNLVQVSSMRKESLERFSVKSYDLPKKYKALTPEATLAEIVKIEIASHGVAPGTETQREIAKHSDFPALDVKCETGDWPMQNVVVIRAILVGNRVYVLSAQGNNIKPAEMWWIRKFFISFEPLDKPKEEGKK